MIFLRVLSSSSVQYFLLWCFFGRVLLAVATWLFSESMGNGLISPFSVGEGEESSCSSLHRISAGLNISKSLGNELISPFQVGNGERSSCSCSSLGRVSEELNKREVFIIFFCFISCLNIVIINLEAFANIHKQTEKLANSCPCPNL